MKDKQYGTVTQVAGYIHNQCALVAAGTKQYEMTGHFQCFSNF